MKCAKCGGEHVKITMQQVGAKTRTKKMGCLWSLGRLFMICMTCGLWLLVGKRHRTGNTKFIHKKYAVCQDCGYSWRV